MYHCTRHIIYHIVYFLHFISYITFRMPYHINIIQNMDHYVIVCFAVSAPEHLTESCLEAASPHPHPWTASDRRITIQFRTPPRAAYQYQSPACQKQENSTARWLANKHRPQGCFGLTRAPRQASAATGHFKDRKSAKTIKAGRKPAHGLPALCASLASPLDLTDSFKLTIACNMGKHATIECHNDLSV